jgi:hypothetical protein
MLQKFSHLKILGARRATWIKLHTEDPNKYYEPMLQNFSRNCDLSPGILHPLLQRILKL